MNKLPQTIYVKIEKEREPEEDFLIASVDVSCLA